MLRGYNTALGCSRKHTNMAYGQAIEVAQKLRRELRDKKWNVSSATRADADACIRNLDLTIVQHLKGEIIPQLTKKNEQGSADDLDILADDMRRLRQELMQTGLPFKVYVPLSKNIIDIWNGAIPRLEEFITHIDQYAIEIKQELDCEPCEEDLGSQLKGTKLGGVDSIMGTSIILSILYFLLCPICFIGVCSIVGLAGTSYLHGSPIILGTFVGVVVTSVSMTTDRALRKKNLTFRFQLPVITYALLGISIIIYYILGVC